MTVQHDPQRPGALPARWRLDLLALIFLPAFVLFAIGGTTSVNVPGIYMDAVNPDYLVVLLLHPHHAAIADGHLRGTLLFRLFPILGQIYHGALPYYVGLPFYTLFGTGVYGIRLTNMVFGLLVLSGTGAFMFVFVTRPIIAACCLASLALDPGFLFSFRTQFYITLLPMAALLASAAVIEARAAAPRRRDAVLSGLLSGIACYGYFIYGFLVPAVALFALYRWRYPSGTRSLVLRWLAGFGIGVLPYAIGFLLILISTGGLRAFITFMTDTAQAQSATTAAIPLRDAIAVTIGFVHDTIVDVGPTAMMLKSPVRMALPQFKVALLLLMPAIAIVSGLSRPARVRGLLVLALMMVGFFALVVTFGRRLWLHHAALMLPLLYAALALALDGLADLLAPRWPRGTTVVAGLVTVPLLIANASDQKAVFRQLQATGGVDLASDGIDRYAEDSLHSAEGAHRFFPDWGIFMSFLMLTRGAVPYSLGFSPAAARAVLCSGQDVELAVLADRPEKRLQDWIAAVAWTRYETAQVNQRDGRPLLYLVRWHAADRAPGACA